MAREDFTGDLETPPPPAPPGPLPPEVMARIDAALDVVQADWVAVDCYQLDGIIISAKALHIAVEALRKHLHDPKCWEPTAAPQAEV